MRIKDLKDGIVFIAIYIESEDSGVFLSYIKRHIQATELNSSWGLKGTLAEVTDICMLSGDGIVEEDYTITNEEVFKLLYHFDESTSLELRQMKNPEKHILDLYPELMI